MGKEIVLKNDNIILNQDLISKVEKKDKLFAFNLQNTKLNLLSFIKKTPSFLKLITDQLREGDIYIAEISSEARKGMADGTFEKLYKKGSKLWNGSIRRTDGHKQILEQADFRKLNASSELLSNLNQISLQMSIAEVSEMILNLDEKLNSLINIILRNYAAKVIAGKHIYEQAIYTVDSEVRKAQLINALQSFNEGRASMMIHLEDVLSQKLRDEKFTDKLWKIIGFNKREIDFYREIIFEYDKIKNDLIFINLANAYIFRIHSLIGEYRSAEKSKDQYIEFCKIFSNQLELISKFFPYESNNKFSLSDITKDFEISQIKTLNSFDLNRHLMIEINYKELTNDKM